MNNQLIQPAKINPVDRASKQYNSSYNAKTVISYQTIYDLMLKQKIKFVPDYKKQIETQNMRNFHVCKISAKFYDTETQILYDQVKVPPFRIRSHVKQHSQKNSTAVTYQFMRTARYTEYLTDTQIREVAERLAMDSLKKEWRLKAEFITNKNNLGKTSEEKEPLIQKEYKRIETEEKEKKLETEYRIAKNEYIIDMVSKFIHDEFKKYLKAAYSNDDKTITSHWSGSTPIRTFYATDRKLDSTKPDDNKIIKDNLSKGINETTAPLDNPNIYFRLKLFNNPKPEYNPFRTFYNGPLFAGKFYDETKYTTTPANMDYFVSKTGGKQILIRNSNNKLEPICPNNIGSWLTPESIVTTYLEYEITFSQQGASLHQLITKELHAIIAPRKSYVKEADDELNDAQALYEGSSYENDDGLEGFNDAYNVAGPSIVTDSTIISQYTNPNITSQPHIVTNSYINSATSQSAIVTNQYTNSATSQSTNSTIVNPLPIVTNPYTNSATSQSTNSTIVTNQYTNSATSQSTSSTITSQSPNITSQSPNITNQYINQSTNPNMTSYSSSTITTNQQTDTNPYSVPAQQFKEINQVLTRTRRRQ